MSEFGYRCEHCDGTVRPKRVKREVFKHKARFVILEDVTIGVCEECGSRCYAAETVKRVREVATGAVSPECRQAAEVCGPGRRGRGGGPRRDVSGGQPEPAGAHIP